MAKFRHQKSKKTGLPPGTLLHTGDKKMENSDISLISYNETEFIENNHVNINDIKDAKSNHSTKEWLNIKGVHDTKLIEEIGNIFNLHPLLLEDILSVHQRPKIDEYENCLFIIARVLNSENNYGTIQSEQVSFILKENTLITFLENNNTSFEIIRERLRKAKGRVRKMESDYLLYALLDAIVDQYFVILDKMGEKLELIETDLLEEKDDKIINRIYKTKSEVMYIRKTIVPMRELVSTLMKGGFEEISESTQLFMKDLYDHIIQVYETTESYRDTLSGFMDIHLSSSSNKMNRVMKVLTIISTIFIPLTFIVGVYGMNFHYMPELEWKHGYFLIWAIMVAILIGMLYYFKKKKWL
jgi:magnesium transporter